MFATLEGQFHKANVLRIFENEAFYRNKKIVIEPTHINL
jgi:hypothetical protein